MLVVVSPTYFILHSLQLMRYIRFLDLQLNLSGYIFTSSLSLICVDFDLSLQALQFGRRQPVERFLFCLFPYCSERVIRRICFSMVFGCVVVSKVCKKGQDTHFKLIVQTP